MIFSSTVFLFAFLPVVIAIYYNPFISGRRFKNIFLLLASLGFYAWGEPVYVFLMLMSISITHAVGIMIDKHGKAALITGIIYHMVMLFLFKYASFVFKEVGGGTT